MTDGRRPMTGDRGREAEAAGGPQPGVAPEEGGLHRAAVAAALSLDPFASGRNRVTVAVGPGGLAAAPRKITTCWYSPGPTSRNGVVVARSAGRPGIIATPMVQDMDHDPALGVDRQLIRLEPGDGCGPWHERARTRFSGFNHPVSRVPRAAAGGRTDRIQPRPCR